MRLTLAIGGILLASIAAVFLLNGAALGSLIFWGPKFEDARRNIEQHSIRRQEGVSEGIGALCLNMKLEKDLDAKKAFATLIVQQATATGTVLTPAADVCVEEARSIMQ